MDSEIRWVLKNGSCAFSFRSCDGLAGLFRVMFYDSAIAQRFTLQKISVLTSSTMALLLIFKTLINNVKQSEICAISFNESLNSVFQMGQWIL